jgi:integrase
MKDRSKYLNRVNGHIYFRANGERARLPGAEGSPEFNAAYDRLFAQAQRDKRERHQARKRDARDGVGTIEWFIKKYLASEYFVGRDGKLPKFAPGTQVNYRAGLQAMCVDVLAGMQQPIGKAKLADITPKGALTYLTMVSEQRKPTVARLHRFLLSNLWKFAMRLPEFDPGNRTNPLVGIGEAQFYTVEQEHEPWPDDVQDRFTAACDKNLYLAYHLLLCTGQRLSDVVKMQWSQYDGTFITLTQQKTKKTNDPLRIKAPKVLRDLLAKTPRVHDNILTHKWGRPYTRDSLGHRIKEVLIANGDGQYTTHGLRKNAGITLAENGATVPQIMAALGHKTPKLALYYCRLANQKKLNEQAAEIIDMVFERKAAAKAAKVAVRRAQIRPV